MGNCCISQISNQISGVRFAEEMFSSSLKCYIFTNKFRSFFSYKCFFFVFYKKKQTSSLFSIKTSSSSAVQHIFLHYTYSVNQYNPAHQRPTWPSIHFNGVTHPARTAKKVLGFWVTSHCAHYKARALVPFPIMLL